MIRYDDMTIYDAPHIRSSRTRSSRMRSSLKLRSVEHRQYWDEWLPGTKGSWRLTTCWDMAPLSLTLWGSPKGIGRVIDDDTIRRYDDLWRSPSTPLYRDIYLLKKWVEINICHPLRLPSSEAVILWGCHPLRLPKRIPNGSSLTLKKSFSKNVVEIFTSWRSESSNICLAI